MHVGVFTFAILSVVLGKFNVAFADGSFDRKITAGWLERIVLVPSGLKMRAKLDTGAKTSSIHARSIEMFSLDGRQWIRFQVNSKRYRKQKPIIIERPLVRVTLIREHQSPPVERPIVNLSFCLDNKIYSSEFSLVDRSNFNYQILLGRRFLQQGIVVDPNLKFTLEANRKICKKRYIDKDRLATPTNHLQDVK